MRIVNCTPHEIVLRPAAGPDLVLAPSGIIPRVSTTPGEQVGECEGIPLFSAPTTGDVVDLPSPEEGTLFVVSGFVAAAVSGREDIYSPGTGPSDGAIRENGRIVAVTRLIQAPRR